jgi:hypothetical protein
MRPIRPLNSKMICLAHQVPKVVKMDYTSSCSELL